MADWNADRLADEAMSLAKDYGEAQGIVFGAFVHLLAQEYAAIAQQILDETKMLVAKRAAERKVA